MSEAMHGGAADMASATDTRQRAAAWLMERRDREDWSEKDQAELDGWLAESPAHRVAYLRVDAAWRRTDRLAALRRPAAGRAGKGRPVWPRLARVAGVTGVAGVLSIAAANYFLHPAEKIYATSVGGRETVRLDDGSKIELNTNTVLRAAVNTRYRTVWLERGEAFFQIAHDTQHSFIVMAGDRRVTVLGTKFMVRRDTDRLEIAVVEGRVRLDSTDGHAQSPALLTPGDDVVAPANALLVTRKTAHELTDALGWRRGVLVFDHTTLGEAAAEFNRYNRDKLVVADASAARMTIDGTFQANNVSDFTHLMQAILGLHVEKRGEETVISR